MNYGGGELTAPAATLDLARGRARFTSGRAPFGLLRRHYERSDRTVYRQTLHLGAAGVQRIQALVARDSRPRVRAEPYDVLTDNCTTRVRDLIDVALDGRLRAATAGRTFDRPYRTLVRAGLGADYLVGLAADLVAGPAFDRTPSVWDAMFLPDVLRAEISQLRAPSGEPVAEPVETLAERRGPDPTASSPRTAAALPYGVTLGAATVVALLARAGPRARLAALALTGIVLGGPGLLVWGMAAAGGPLVARNANLLLLWPTDLALLALAAWLRRPRLASLALGYLALRVAAALGLALAALAGGIVQPVMPQAVLVMLVSGAAALAVAGIQPAEVQPAGV